MVKMGIDQLLMVNQKKSKPSNKLSFGELVSIPPKLKDQKFIAKQDLMVGIVQIGYADGIFTDFMNVGEVVFDDKKLPIIGKVSMDTVCNDITSENVKKGDSVSIWGDPSKTITLESLSKKYNRIPYEYLTAISERVRKEYIYE